MRKAAPWYRRASLLGPQAALGEVLWGVFGVGFLGDIMGILLYLWIDECQTYSNNADSLRTSGGSWEGLGGGLGPSWGGLGPLLGGLGGVLGGLGVLGWSWGVFGKVLARPGLRLGVILGESGDVLRAS